MESPKSPEPPKSLGPTKTLERPKSPLESPKSLLELPKSPLEPLKSPLPPPPSSRYPSPPASSPAPNGAKPELSGLGGPNGKFQWSTDRFSDYEEQDECAKSPSKANQVVVTGGKVEESLFVEEQMPEQNEKAPHTAEDEKAISTSDPAEEGDIVEQNVASILPQVMAEESELSESPDEPSSEESEDSEYEDNSSSSADTDDDEKNSSPVKDKGNAHEQANKVVKKNKSEQPRRKISLNAREYVARLHEKEDKKYAKRLQHESKKSGEKRPGKRKLTGDDAEPRKTLKTANGTFLSIAKDSSSISDGSSLLPMEPIQANTHAQQFAQLRAAQLKSQIPQNCDTRRKNTQNQDLREAKHCKAPIKDKVFIEIISQFPSNSVLRELEEKYSSDDVSFRRELEARVGTIFGIKWYRIILDEAHAIKNVNSRTSKACCALLGKYRWALSGTPLANSSEEMYPYLKFTECESTLTSKEFKAMYTSYGKSNSRFEALISLIMYRRTMNDEFMGHKIINLPEKKEIDLLVPLSMEEQVIVEAVKSFYKKAAKRLKQGTIGKDQLEAAVDNLDDAEEDEDEEKGDKAGKIVGASSRSMSHRLGHASQVRKRQAISHPFCIERLLRRSFEEEDLKELIDALEKLPSKQTIIQQIRLKMGKDCDMLRYETGLKLLEQREEAMFGKSFDMKTLLKLARADKENRRANKGNRQGDMHNCPHKDCGKELEVGEDIETVQTNLDSLDKRYREPGRDSNNVIIRQDDDRNGFFICSTFLQDVPTVPSARLTATMAIALTWLHEAPDDKILIFTQFIGTAKILGYMLDTLGIGFVYYWGGLPGGQKRKALEAIKQNADVKVMVSTLKSGGQCLNLTVANRVIIIDPWWNKTAEQQAFGRVTRMGQTKETHLVTIKTEDETDSRIHTLQVKKAADVDYTLQDDGHTPPEVSELELQQELLRRKEEQEEKQKRKAARVTKKKRA
ncbi:hypothetical protein TrVFT333_010419 [Trichoderma virens FT-333]|nr:hypothetical protein TrVFT333_010419 [Trichoderma virens FT-333]